MTARNALIIGSDAYSAIARDVVLILKGANRGLGLGLLKIFKENGYNIFGTIRPQTRSDSSYKDVCYTLFLFEILKRL